MNQFLSITHEVIAAGSLKIPWAQTPMYNTLMSVAAGVALLLVVAFGYQLLHRRPIVAEGWSAAFAVLGVVLAVTGAHMTLTWPLANIFPFDNIIFGEPSLAFGLILLAAAAMLAAKRGALGQSPKDDAVITYVRALSAPLSLFGAGMGLGLLGIAAAGWRYTLFAAPPQEPISGNFANYPLVEATFISGLYLLVGVGLLLLPLGLRWLKSWLLGLIGVCWVIPGIAFTVFGALNYFTHIGLIINTT